MPETWLAVGLGNPGEKFANTRHNAGARAIERLAEELGVKMKAPKSRLRPGKPAASVAEAASRGQKIILARPSTFMNESGRAVASLLGWFKVDAENLIVVHDEIDLAEGALRVQFGRGSGGHRGVGSIIRAVSTQEFFRVRIGVGRPPALSEQDPADFVLEPMSKDAAGLLAEVESKAAEAVVCLVHDGLESTMSRFNSR